MLARVIEQPSVVLKGSGGHVVFTPRNTLHGNGRISAVVDLGSGPRTPLYRWFARCRFQAALAPGNVMEIYLAEGDGTRTAGNFSTADALVTNNYKRNNLRMIGRLIADDTANGEPQVGCGEFRTTARYVQVLWWNAMGQTLTNADEDHEFILTPLSEESL